MQVIALENVPSAQRGGKELSLLEVTRALAERGHTINLLYLAQGDLLAQYRQYAAPLIQLPEPRLQVRQFLHSAWTLAQSLRQTNQQLRQATSLQQRPERIVYLDQDRGCFFAVLLAKLMGCPSVFHIRQPLFTNFPQQERLALRGIDRFIAVSEQTRRDWASLGISIDKIEVIHNGTNPDRFHPTTDVIAAKGKLDLSGGTLVLSYLGRLDQEKGLEYLITAAAKVSHAITTPIQVLIAGKPVCHASAAAGQAYVNQLKTLAEKLGVGDRVRFLGHLSDTATLYQASDITLLPSLNSEPFGKVVIEAMACGVPVVASRIGGIPEILTGEFATGLVPPADAEALATALIKYLSWRTQDPTLGHRCRQHVLHHFTMAQTIDRIEAFLSHRAH